jgi:flagellar basal body P-ring formation protein FlgA
MIVALVLLAKANHACSASVSSSVWLTLRVEAVVPGETVALCDLADVAGLDADSMRRVCAVPLGAAPRVGEVLRLDRRAIESWLAQRLQSDELFVQWSGATEVALRRADQLVDPERVSASASKALQNWLLRRDERVTVSTQTPDPVRVPAGRLSLQARRLPEDMKPARHFQVWVDVMVNDRFVRSIPVVCSASVYRDGWVATHDLHAEQSLSGASLKRMRVDVAGQRDEPLANLPESGRLRRPVRAGHALTAADIEDIPAVARGAPVTLRSQLGDISVEARAQAMQDGWPGQQVLVRLGQGKPAVQARVVDTGVAEVLR